MKVKLVVNSASIKCEHCPESGELTIPPTSGILVTGQWVASKYDVLVPINIKPFRHCKKRSDKEGIDLCIPENIRQWENTKDDIDILEGIPAITDKSFAICYYLGSNRITINDSGQGLVEVDEILYWEFPDLEELLKNPDFVKFLQNPSFQGLWDPTIPGGPGIERLEFLWDYCKQIGDENGIVFDPLIMLAILQAEGTGSFNTAVSNINGSNGNYNKIGHIATTEYTKDIPSAVNLMLSKMRAYGLFSEKFKEESSKYTTLTPGGHIAHNGGFYEYAHYFVPCLNLDNSKANHTYAAGANWNSVVEEYYAKLNAYLHGYTNDDLKNDKVNQYEYSDDYSGYIEKHLPYGIGPSEAKNWVENSNFQRVRYEYYLYTDKTTGKEVYGQTDAVIDMNGINTASKDFIIIHVYNDGEGGQGYSEVYK